MKTAREMLSTSFRAYENHLPKEVERLEMLLEEIEVAASRGHFEYAVDGHILLYQINKLRSLGYSVEQSSAKSINGAYKPQSTISWDWDSICENQNENRSE